MSARYQRSLNHMTSIIISSRNAPVKGKKIFSFL